MFLKKTYSYKDYYIVLASVVSFDFVKIGSVVLMLL